MERPSGRPAHLSSPLFRWSETRRRGGEERSPLLQSADSLASARPSPLLRVPSQRALPPFPAVAAPGEKRRAERAPARYSAASRHRRTRRPPLTRLEQLGSSQTWALLLLPLLAALLLLSSTPQQAGVRPNHCPAEFVCSWSSDAIEVSTRSPLLLLGHVDVRLSLKEPVRELTDKSGLANLADSFSLFYKVSIIDDSLKSSPELASGSAALRSQLPAHPLLRLDSAALLLPQSRVAVSLTADYDSSSAPQLEDLEILLEFAGGYTVICRAFVQLVLCLVSIVLLGLLVSALHLKVTSLRKTSAPHRERSYLECLLPEQVLFSTLLRPS